MRRLFAPLIAGAIITSMVLAGASVAAASTRPSVAPLNAGSMARTYMNRAMIDYTHMSPTAFAGARNAGCSYRSIAASSGVDTTQVVNAASARAQGVVNSRVRKRMMTRSAARKFMATFRGNCVNYFGPLSTAPGGSTPTTPGAGCLGPWGGSSTTTPTPGLPGAGCWGPGYTGTVPTMTPVPTPGSGWGMSGCW